MLPAAMVLAAALVSVWPGAYAGEVPETAEQLERRVAQLIRELDDDAFRVRRRAELELTRIGRPALRAVERASREGSLEVRERAQRILRRVQHREFLRGLRELMAVEEDREIDLERGMLLISRIVDPLSDTDAAVKKLDAMAAAVRKKLGPDVDPRRADPQRVVEAIRQVVFVEHGLTGNADDYDNPVNSSLAHVLETRKGLPIILSHVAVAVARRLDVPLVGLQIPYRYMVKYDGEHAPQGFPKSDIILDSFDAGKVVTVDELEDIIARIGGGFDPQRHLVPSPHRDTLARMLRNLLSDYQRAGATSKAWQVEQYLRMVEAAEPE